MFFKHSFGIENFINHFVNIPLQDSLHRFEQTQNSILILDFSQRSSSRKIIEILK
jgi:hypothetical protein